MYDVSLSPWYFCKLWTSLEGYCNLSLVQLLSRRQVNVNEISVNAWH